MQETEKKYPIQEVLPNIKTAFEKTGRIILSAPPGAGKTTQVPISLLSANWMNGKKMIMLEPRRLAARRAAEYMSAQLGEEAGGTVGYRIRGESVTGKKTRIEIVTEGILTRMLQNEPDMHDTALVIFDEFHERSIHADLGLALVLDVQENLRNDLKILIMSATLDSVAIKKLLNDAETIESTGKSCPVEIRYAKFVSDKTIETRVAETIMRTASGEEGDMLVFLPGRREIRRVENLLWEKKIQDMDIAVHSLFGEASYNQQAAALSPDPAGRRKVILSTSIAETSLTIDGVRIVIDSGLARFSRFDARRGMSGLVTGPVSRAGADQRCGRAGRQYPGICYRMWTEPEHESLPAYALPEIKTADLAPLALDLALWGTPDGQGLHFIDPPPAPNLIRGRALLKDLGAADINGRLTRHGRDMSELPVHPRLSNMILRGKELGLGAAACDIAALLEEKDVFAGKRDLDIDLDSRLHFIYKKITDGSGARERILAQSKKLRQVAGIDSRSESKKEHTAGILLALAYPERVAARQERSHSLYRMANGTAAILPKGSLLGREDFLAIGEADGSGNEVRIFLAAPISKEELEKIFADNIVEEDDIRWNPLEDSVVARRLIRLGSAIISEKPLKEKSERITAAMIEGIRQSGLQCLPWDKESRSFQQRCEWLRRRTGRQDLPDISDSGLMENLEEWLTPHLAGIRRKEKLAGLRIYKILKSYIPGYLQKEIEVLAPSHLRLPSGSNAAIDYSSGNQPILAVKLQELFGQTETPGIMNDQVPLLLHLLSPASRPLAVTQDLKSFWQNTYPEIRRQMQARYPKHVWPENPLGVKPTNKTARHKKN